MGARLAGLVLIAIATAGCAAQPATVDGWPIGPLFDCSKVPQGYCDRLLAAARDRLDVRDPAHAVVLAGELHDEGTNVDALGHPILMTKSIELSVARFVLADGSLRAIGVADWPSGPIVVDRGP
jgi:hypothetical protein